MRTPQLIEAYEAIGMIREWVKETPLLPSEQIPNLYYKLEQLQPSGSFKWRGAVNALTSILNTTENVKPIIVCASTGNHGLAVTKVSIQLGFQVKVVVSNLTPENKVKALKDAGAEVIQQGKSQDEAFVIADGIVKEQNGVWVSQFDTPEVIVGHMTIALEIINQLPKIDKVLIPLSGGGLLVGLALVFKQIHPNCRIIGVSMERGAAMYSSLQAQKVVMVEEELTLADSLGGGVTDWTFNEAKHLIDESVLVSEDDIYRAIHDLYHHEGLVVEGAGAVGLAAVQSKKVYLAPNENVVTIISGKNIDREVHEQIVGREPVTLSKQMEHGEKILSVSYPKAS